MIEIWKTLGCVIMTIIMGTGLVLTTEFREFLGMLLFGMAFAFWANLFLDRFWRLLENY